MKTTQFLTIALTGLMFAAGTAYAVPSYKEYENLYYSTQFGAENGADTLTLKVADTIQKDSKYSMLVMREGDSEAEAKESLKNMLTSSAQSGDKNFGYYRTTGNSTSTFTSLAGQLENVKIETETVTLNGTTYNNAYARISLGEFKAGDTVQFGYATNESDFVAQNGSVHSDPNYYAGYNIDKFYQLDFADKQFDGYFDFIIAGEPLPPQVITLLIALAAGAAFVFYRSRRENRAVEA